MIGFSFFTILFFFVKYQQFRYLYGISSLWSSNWSCLYLTYKIQVMETKIQRTLSQWFPEAFVDLDLPVSTASDYVVLRHFAGYAQKLIRENNECMNSPFRIINLLYAKGTLYERNAIENEFFKALAIEEKSMTLKQQLGLMPESLRPICIKTILEN